MAPVSVLLGSFGICTRDPGALLTITSSITISLPSPWEGDVTAARLSEEAKRGALWIARAGRCRLEIFHDSAEEDTQALPKETEQIVSQQLACAVEQCPLWVDLGLNLARKYDHRPPTVDSQRHTSFLVQHPDLNSELLSPEEVPCARFLALSCIISVQPTLNDSKKRERTSEKPELNGSVTRKQKRQKRDHIDKFARRSETALPHQHGSALQATEPPSISVTDALEQPTTTLAFDEEDVCRLMSYALHALVGIKKQMVGLKLVGEAPSPTLIEIAPAVWSVPYLEAMAARARFMPTIASVLGGLVDAESPRLRRKVADLPNTNASQAGQATSNTKKEIRRRLEVLLRRNLSFTPVVKKRDARRRNIRIGTAAINHEENGVSAEDVENENGPHNEGDIYSHEQPKSDPSFDPAIMVQRSSEEVADDVNALHGEMAAILGTYPDEFSTYESWQTSPYSQDEHQGASFNESLEYGGNPRDTVLAESMAPLPENIYVHHDSEYIHGVSPTYLDSLDTGYLPSQDVFDERIDEEVQFFQLQNDLDDYQETYNFNQIPESSENVRFKYAPWGHHARTGVDEEDHSSQSQQLSLHNLAPHQELDYFDEEILYEDDLLLQEHFI